MAEREPLAEQMLSDEAATVIPWADIRERIVNGSTHWLTTVRPDGRPHIVPVGVAWLDGALYFTTGQGTRKGENLAHNPHCAIAVANGGFDIVVEGEAARVKDAAKLQRVAELYAANGWPATVGDGALDAPYSAPTTGPAPYDVYEMTPMVAYAFGTTDETAPHPTRYRF
ncbi:MAG TPA: pyridoxamine 5'-phosphate oxidase family protein [Chloroflexia bacterium]|jgi:hypothetical protein